MKDLKMMKHSEKHQNIKSKFKTQNNIKRDSSITIMIEQNIVI